VLYTASTPWHDFNGNNNLDNNPILLEGHECLVFFLGGIPTSTGTGFGVGGFAKNPVNPFQGESVTTNRSPAYFEFKAERLIDDDGDGMPGYIDSLASGTDGRYFAYFSAYGNGGYDPNDVNGPEPDLDSGTPAISRMFRVGFGVASQAHPTIPNTVYSPAPNPYTSSDAVPILDSQTAPPYQPTVYINPNSYQIISAGRDREYGFGGRYNANSAGDRLPFDAADLGSNPPRIIPANNPKIRQRETDNITNFSNGRLE
jgi:general secretion pathway protein G